MFQRIKKYFTWKKYSEQLKNFYNQEAQKFSNTRKKHWPEFNLILQELKNYSNNYQKMPDPIKILELWCGDWRFLGFLKENFDKNFEYVWVDFSENLLKIAQKNYEDSLFVQQDMISFLNKENQQKYDFVISIASIQHIYKFSQRKILFENINKVLKYWWKHISINWAMSKKFWQNYKIQIIISYLKYFFTFGIWDYNNILVPFKSNNKIYKRLYHIFSCKEIKLLTDFAWLILEKCFFVWPKWNKVEQSQARNLFFVQKKDVSD